MLLAAITQEDVKREVFSMSSKKSPGPDGYTGKFFRRIWDILEFEVKATVQEFFSSGQILK